MGEVKLQLTHKTNRPKLCNLHDVLYVPELAYNLFSVSRATVAGKYVKFSPEGCEILDEDDKLVAVGCKKGDLYYLKCQRIDQEQIHVSDSAINASSKEFLWHKRFGHLNERSLQTLARKKLVDGFDYDRSQQIPFCQSCIEGKLHKVPFGQASNGKAETYLALVHSDVCGPLSSKSLSGATYFLTFTDDKTRFTWVYFLKNKSDVYEKFQEWKALVERESGNHLKALRTDNGGEYTSSVFKSYLACQGIRHELTIPKTPEQNGVAERLNRTLVESVQSMLSHARLPHKFWAEALSTVVYLKNRSYTSSVPEMTPLQAWSGKKPCVKNLRVFGCTAYFHIPKDERKKLDPKARRSIFLGYGDVTKGYRLYDPMKSRVIHSRNVVFEENQCDGLEKQLPESIIP